MAREAWRKKPAFQTVCTNFPHITQSNTTFDIFSYFLACPRKYFKEGPKGAGGCDSPTPLHPQPHKRRPCANNAILLLILSIANHFLPPYSPNKRPLFVSSSSGAKDLERGGGNVRRNNRFVHIKRWMRCSGKKVTQHRLVLTMMLTVGAIIDRPQITAKPNKLHLY